jgi:hypothetical protein
MRFLAFGFITERTDPAILITALKLIKINFNFFPRYSNLELMPRTQRARKNKNLYWFMLGFMFIFILFFLNSVVLKGFSKRSFRKNNSFYSHFNERAGCLCSTKFTELAECTK